MEQAQDQSTEISTHRYHVLLCSLVAKHAEIKLYLRDQNILERVLNQYSLPTTAIIVIITHDHFTHLCNHDIEVLVSVKFE